MGLGPDPRGYLKAAPPSSNKLPPSPTSSPAGVVLTQKTSHMAPGQGFGEEASPPPATPSVGFPTPFPACPNPLYRPQVRPPTPSMATKVEALVCASWPGQCIGSALDPLLERNGDPRGGPKVANKNVLTVVFLVPTQSYNSGGFLYILAGCQDLQGVFIFWRDYLFGSGSCFREEL